MFWPEKCLFRNFVQLTNCILLKGWFNYLYWHCVEVNEVWSGRKIQRDFPISEQASLHRIAISSFCLFLKTQIKFLLVYFFLPIFKIISEQESLHRISISPSLFLKTRIDVVAYFQDYYVAIFQPQPFTKQSFLILLVLQVLQAIVKQFCKLGQKGFYQICQKLQVAF